MYVDNSPQNPVIVWILIGWILTVGFFVYWFARTGTVWGKSDVDNYMSMETMASPQHAFMMLINRLPRLFYILFIPSMFWFGIVLPSHLLSGEEDGAFCLVFGTGALFQVLIVSLWAQFCGMAVLFWGIYLAMKKRRFCPLIILGVLMYVPSAWFGLFLVSPSAFVLAGMAFMSVWPQYFFWGGHYASWNPLMTVLLVSPVLLRRLFLSRPWKREGSFQAAFLLSSMTILGRNLAYFYPLLACRLSRREKVLTVAWFLLVVCFQLTVWKWELYNCTVNVCRRVFFTFL